jgi:hypothetical protein
MEHQEAYVRPFFHGLGVFASFKGDSIKERMIEKEMENQKKNQK